MLNVRSTVAVLTGRAIKMEARFDKFGNAGIISAVPTKMEKNLL